MYFPLTADQQDQFEKEFHQAHMFRLRCSSENEYKFLKAKADSGNELSDYQQGKLKQLKITHDLMKKIGDTK